TFSLVVPDGVIPGQLGSSVVLPCTVSPALDWKTYEIQWYRPHDKDNPIQLYKDLKVQENTGDPRYRNRVSLIGELGKGNVSLKLENLTLADRGEYVCYVESYKWYERASVFLNLPDSERLVSVSSWLLVSPSESEWISCSVGLSDQEMKEGRIMPLKPATVIGYTVVIIALVISLLMLVAMGVFIFRIRGRIFPKRSQKKSPSTDWEKMLRRKVCIQVQSSDSTLGCWFRERIHSGQYYWEVTGLTDASINTEKYKNIKCPTSWYVGVTNQSAERRRPVPVTPQNGYWVLQYDKDKGYYVNDPSLTPVLVRVMILLLLVFDLLSCANADTFSLVVPDGAIKGQLGSSVVLPCTVSPQLDCKSYEVHWYGPNDKENMILLYKYLKVQEDSGDPRYRNRVSLIGELEKGNVSLKLEKLTLADRGAYMCYVNSYKWYEEANVFLSLPVVGSPPLLSFAEAGDKMNVTCASGGWAPNTSLTWRDKEGRELRNSVDHYRTDSEGLVSVSSWLLFSPSESEWISCSVGLSDQEMKEGRVLPLKPDSGNDADTKSEPGISPGGTAVIIALVVSLLLLAGIAVFIFKIRGRIFPNHSQKESPSTVESKPSPSSDVTTQTSEGGEDGRWEMCLPQASQEVETLVGFLGYGAGVEGPGGILCQVWWLVILADETHHSRIICKLDDVVRAVHCCTVVSQQVEQQRTEHTALGGPSAQRGGAGDKFSLVVPDAVVGQLGSSVVLPCALSPSLNCKSCEVHWYGPNNKDNQVLLYKDLKVQENTGDPRNRNRVSLIGELEKGNVSLKLENLTLADRGEYVCYVESYKWYERASVVLNLPVVGSPPLLSLAEAGNEMNVTCASGGWSPNTTLTWRDQEGRELTNSVDQYRTDSEGLVSVSSWLLFSPSESEWISCSVGLSDQELKEGRVLPLKPAIVTGVSPAWTAFIITVICLLLLVVMAVFIFKIRGRKCSVIKRAGKYNINHYYDKYCYNKFIIETVGRIFPKRSQKESPSTAGPETANKETSTETPGNLYNLSPPLCPVCAVRETNKPDGATQNSGWDMMYACKGIFLPLLMSHNSSVNTHVQISTVAIKPGRSDAKGVLFKERIRSGQYFWIVTGLPAQTTQSLNNTNQNPTLWYVGVTNQTVLRELNLPLTPQNGYWVLQNDRDKGYCVNDSSLIQTVQVTVMILLLLVFDLLSCANGDTFSLVVPDGVISGQLGSSVVLPCTVSPALDCTSYEVGWYGPNDKENPILLYKDLKVQENTGDPRYRNRVSLTGEMGKGNVSLKLEKLTLADRGEYECYVNSDLWYDRASVLLNLSAVGSLPVLSFTEAGEQVNVTCASGGWLPNPTLTWRDKEGQELKSVNHYITDSEGLVSVSSWLLFSPSESEWISCSVGLSDQEMKEGRVLPLKLDSGVSPGYAVVIILLVISLLLLVVMAVFIFKIRGRIFPKHSQKKTASTAFKPPPSSDGATQTSGPETANKETNTEENYNYMCIFSVAIRPNPSDGKGVLFKERMCSGRYFWIVKGLHRQTKPSLKNTNICPSFWYVGVTNATVMREPNFPVTPQNGYWVLQNDRDKGYYVNDPSLTPVLVKDQFPALGVFLDCEKHTLSFYDWDNKLHLYTFYNVPTTSPLIPVIYPGLKPQYSLDICQIDCVICNELYR
ncbi:hypothetical protein NFI96_027093, partial [Prochilodus magdalenae]